jgi:hypothetical protein
LYQQSWNLSIYFRNQIGTLLRWLAEGSVKGFVCLTLLFAVHFIFIPTFAATEFVANVYCSLPFGLRLLVSWRFCAS